MSLDTERLKILDENARSNRNLGLYDDALEDLESD